MSGNFLHNPKGNALDVNRKPQTANLAVNIDQIGPLGMMAAQAWSRFVAETYPGPSLLMDTNVPWLQAPCFCSVSTFGSGLHRRHVALTSDAWQFHRFSIAFVVHSI